MKIDDERIKSLADELFTHIFNVMKAESMTNDMARHIAIYTKFEFENQIDKVLGIGDENI
jgi:hypothetical protein